jgi:hypothetical protein
VQRQVRLFEVFDYVLKENKALKDIGIQMPDGISNSAIKFLITQSKVHVSIDPL